MFSAMDIPQYMSYLASTYGPISMIYIGQQPFVCLHSIDAITEVFDTHNIIDRAQSSNLFVFQNLNPHEIEHGFVSQKYWHVKRKLLQTVLISQLNSSFLNESFNHALTSHVIHAFSKPRFSFF
jgi:hypothetical protein